VVWSGKRVCQLQLRIERFKVHRFVIDRFVIDSARFIAQRRLPNVKAHDIHHGHYYRCFACEYVMNELPIAMYHVISGTGPMRKDNRIEKDQAL